jgi:hypothetical protein
VNKPAHIPFSQRVDFTFTGGGAQASFQVPSGQRLVITYISADVETATGAHVYTDFATTNGSEVEAHIPVQDQGVFAGSEIFDMSEKTEIFADPGSLVSILVVDSDSTHGGGGIIGIYGYLVSASAASFE